MFDIWSLLIGLFLGMIIMIILSWISYNNKILIFANLPTQGLTCRSNQYFNNPVEAIKHGANPKNMFSIKDGELYYTRVPKELCRPGSSQTIPVQPQFCEFTTEDGYKFEAKNDTYDSPYYFSTSGEKIEVYAPKNCKPLRSTSNVVSGHPKLKWESYD